MALTMAAATTEDFYYDGFRTFQWMADIISVPIDQVSVCLSLNKWERKKKNFFFTRQHTAYLFGSAHLPATFCVYTV